MEKIDKKDILQSYNMLNLKLLFPVQWKNDELQKVFFSDAQKSAFFPRLKPAKAGVS